MKSFRLRTACAALIVGCFFSFGEQARRFSLYADRTGHRRRRRRHHRSGHSIADAHCQSGRCFVSRIRAWDAAGANPIVLVDMATDVANSSAASRILITTPNFDNYVGGPPVVSDFTMVPIPASYLAAGRITFETNNGAIIYWSLAWGGGGYTGSNAGNTANDADGGTSGPPFAGPLPSSTRSSLLINRLFNQTSTNNAANYGVIAGSATFTNNAGNSFLVIPEPGTLGLGFAGFLVLRGRRYRRK